ncbi:transporter substrate-binding domain-containing protein [Pelagibacterium sp. H642]|uniref:substrate-binding periplasmic protein n=1 Tax=Pelagibacterium sp. H642 TaxID=1881069 RepID=UPI0028151A80|nr:transporter substrate-binding domain-containing protein [Pelagibacterium sp. H642]WMT90057.1 transporter substrate-binding domain-containing protein [Pelagibacterium sp. H642]
MVHRLFFAALLLAFVPLAGIGQDRPFLYNEEEFGQPSDANELRICIDPRDPAWEIDRAIAEEIASVLLLEPVIHMIEDTRASVPLDDVYYYLRANCRVYFGFRLIADLYPTWAMATRPYYEARYVFVTDDPEYSRLADLPAGAPIAATLASSADFRFTQFNNALPAAQRWRRVPFGTDTQSLDALEQGVVEAALIWGPALLAEQRPGLAIMSPEPLAFDPMPVGGLLLSTDTFLRTSIDDAIAALSAAGTLERLVREYPYLSPP